jgi:hypothetical protein
MSKEYSFSVMPSVSISRSRFARKSQHKTSFNLGYIIPVYVDEVLPGDTRSIDMAGLIRMSTPIAPIMDNIYIDYFAFFVPNRLVWTHWKEFMGENNSSAGIPTQSYSVPAEASPMANTSASVGSLADYFGLPVGINYLFGKVSSLPFRGYHLIYNEWFRDQNIIAPYPINYTDNAGSKVYQGYSIGNELHKAAKLSDYFTRSLPYAQKGTPVSLPLGNTAPLKADTNISPYNLGVPTGSTATFGKMRLAGASNLDTYIATDASTTALVADLSNATAATINQLRYAFQLQKFLEKDALYGTRYWEILAAHFGIKAPDASLQRPEYLGGYRQRVNIDQVLTTAGYDDTSATLVGKPGANSVSGFKSSIFTKSFTEHGYIFILAVARHDQTYAQGVNRMWSRKNRYDYYFPVFANLGAQDVKLKEIFFQGTSADENIFGYQEAWAEYRYKPSIASGLLNPNATGALSYWTLTNKFGSAPTLGQTFIEQGRDNLQRALATGSTGPDFIADFYFEDIAVRPMPMYSIPGLIDHH